MSAAPRGEMLAGEDWLFYWRVTSWEQNQKIYFFRTGQSVTREPLRYWGNELLECIIRSITPAHTIVHFAYQHWWASGMTPRPRAGTTATPSGTSSYDQRHRPQHPVHGNPTTQSVRDNFAIAAKEISDLQTLVSSLMLNTPYLPLAGGLMTGSLLLAADTAQDTEAATKLYVDALRALITDLEARVAALENPPPPP